MISQPTINETFAVLTPSGINFPQTEKPKPASQRQDSLKKHLKAEIKVLGTIQIFCGVMVLSLGIILFVISGSLSIITGKKTTKPLVQSSLAANLLSSLSALVGFILLSVNLAALGPAFRECDLTKEDIPEERTYHFNSIDSVDCSIANAILAGALSVMLICTMLEFCIGVLAAVLWWKQAHSSFLGSVIFLPQSYTYKSSVPPKADFDHGYEELLTS